MMATPAAARESPARPTAARLAQGALLAALVAPLVTAGPALADEPGATAASATASGSAAAPPDSDLAAAGRAFQEGERLFAGGDYLLAAASFEEAHSRVPHDASLWNAARSWHRAGELARAANRYSHFLSDAPADAPDRDEAHRALAELSTRLGRLDIQAPGLTDVRVDGAPVRLPAVYVVPGAHVLTGRSGEHLLQRTERVEAGAAAAVVLAEEAPGQATSAPALPPAPGPSAAPPAVTVVVPPAQAYLTPARASTLLAGAVSVVLLGLMIGSGVETLQARAAYDAAATGAEKRAIYFDGVAKQQTTNVLLGVTVGGFVLTGLGVFWIASTETSARRPRTAALAIAGSF